MVIQRVLSRLAIGLIGIWTLGCDSAPTGPPPDIAPVAVQDHDGHDHGHDHAHGHPEHGPNGGHLIEFQTEEYHAEWTHDDDSGKLTIYILDGSAKELVPIAAEMIVIEKKIGDNQSRHDIPAMDRTGEAPKSAKFEIVDKPLIEALKTAGKGVEATLTVDIDGRTFTGKIAHDEHSHGHDHGHKH